MDLLVRLAQSCWKTALLKLWWLNTEAGQVPWEITLLSTCTHNSQALHSWLVVSWSCQDAHISVQSDGFISWFVLCLHIQGTGPKRTVGLQITLILSGNNDSKKKTSPRDCYLISPTVCCLFFCKVGLCNCNEALERTMWWLCERCVGKWCAFYTTEFIVFKPIRLIIC